MSTGNATRWYATREAVKAAAGISGAAQNALVDEKIEEASEDVEEFLGRAFIPETTERFYKWPPTTGGGTVLRIPREDLIAVTQLQTKAQDSSPTTIVEADYFVEPVNDGPPYTHIEIDRSSSAAFAAGDTAQRSIGVTGRWGFREDTKAAGALAEDDDGAELALNVSDSSLIGVGDTILIEPGAAAAAGSVAEPLFVSEKALLDTTANTAGALTASQSEVTIPVDDGTKVKVGEVITIDSERILIESISSNNLTVERAVDGSVLATHANPSDVYAPRTLTVVRAVNGTTATVHDDTDAVVIYAPPADIRGYVIAYAIQEMHLDATKRTGIAGGEDGSVETKGFSVWAKKKALIQKYGVVTF